MNCASTKRAAIIAALFYVRSAGAVLLGRKSPANQSGGGDGGQTNGGLNCGRHDAGGLAFGGAIANNAATVNIKHGTISLTNAQAGNTGVNTPGVNKPPRDAAKPPLGDEELRGAQGLVNATNRCGGIVTEIRMAASGNMMLV